MKHVSSLGVVGEYVEFTGETTVRKRPDRDTIRFMPLLSSLECLFKLLLLKLLMGPPLVSRKLSVVLLAILNAFRRQKYLPIVGFSEQLLSYELTARNAEISELRGPVINAECPKSGNIGG